MRDFSHLILDLEIKKSNTYTKNWLTNAVVKQKFSESVLSNINFYNKLSSTSPRLISDFSDLNAKNLSSSTSFYSSTLKNSSNNINFNIQESININFLRKERLYTKLKYSRSPAYDIVSGGAAAILAGFIGFLISEKFGFELVDSGDFYYLFIYIVFASFSVRPLLVTVSSKDSLSSIFSIKPILNFFITIITIFMKKLKI